MSAELVFEGTLLELDESAEHGWLMSTADVARGFDVDPASVRSAKVRHANELEHGRHWVVAERNTPGGRQMVTLWTRAGVVRLGFLITSDRAVRFRDWAETVVLGELQARAMHPTAGGAPMTTNQALLMAVQGLCALEAEVAVVRAAATEATADAAYAVERTEQLAAKVDRRNPGDEQLEAITPTSIGALLTPPVSGLRANQLLQQAGLQWRQDGRWVPTMDGRPFAVVDPFIDAEGKQRDQLKWQRRIVPVLERRLARRGVRWTA